MANGLRFKGTIEVLVDPARLEARLVLSRDGDLEYDDGAVARILSDAGVTGGYDLDDLVRAIQTFQKSKNDRVEVPAAHGVAPIPPSGETWQWSEDLVPLAEELKTVASRVLKAAGVPELYQVRVEKVKVQKKVVGKAGLFGPGQEEVQTVIENREIREKVLVDPNPLKVHWVEEGTVVAALLAPRAGVPGKDLGGKAIPAPQAKVSGFLGGMNLVKDRTSVTCTASGFLRIGRNWADVVAHRAHRWELSYSSDKTSAFLTFEPGAALAAPPSAREILAKLEKEGFPADRTPQEGELQALLNGWAGAKEAVYSHPLGPGRDGSFAIRFSPDRSKAFLQVHKPLGRGAELSLKDLGIGLREARLKGFSFDSVKGAIQDFLNGPETELQDLLLATGKPPVRGKDLVLAFTLGFLPDAEVKAIQAQLLSNPRMLEGVPDAQKLSPAQVEKAAPVHADMEFARLESPADGEGEPGIDVTGAVIPAIPGNEPELVLLSNVRKNGNKLEAMIDGLLEMGQVNGASVFRVRPHLDALAVVHRSEDNLTAWLTLIQGRGTGRRLDQAMVAAALESAQVRAGIKDEAVTRALETAVAGGKAEHVLVAEGVPAGNDLTRRLTFPQTLRMDAEGKRRGPVRAGEVAARYLPPGEGQVDGEDILGNRIPSPDQEVRSLVVSPDFDISADESGHQVLTSLKSGDLVFDGESLSVVTQVAVATVGGKAANVKFPGEVLVAGGVETGAYVMAGNLKVRGRVGGALLSSDHNIQVADGIHGEGKAVLRAKKHISVGFVERALVMAVGDVIIGKSALGCTFRVNGRVIQKTSGGGVQGGTAKVRLGLEVMNLGAPSGTTTAISFGQDYLVEDQILAEVKETDKLREAIVQLDGMARKLGAPSDRDKLAAVRQKKVLLMKLLDKRNLKLINLRDKFELHVPSEIVVRETLFPGVSIESHGRVYEPRTRKSAVRIVFNEQTGHIEEFPLG